jgi:basic amino acid/polyamine antiporter, APA family
MESKLNNVLNFYDLFFISIGHIVGAGIYTLLYLTTQQGGNFTWLSFLIGGVISICTGLSYAELTRHYDSNATEYDYFNKTITPKFKYSIALVLILKGIFLSITLLLAFSNLSHHLLGKKIPYALIALLSISIPTLINIYDVKFTSNFNIGISITETSVLVILVLLGLSHWNFKSVFNGFNLNGIIYGAFLSVLAYSGYEALPKLSEETKDSKTVIPDAIISSLIVIIFLYSTVSITTNSVLGSKEVSNCLNPITKTFEKLTTYNVNGIINFVTLFSMFNTILLTILIVSRQIYGISKEQNFIPIFDKYISKVNPKTKTPINAILLVSLLTIIGACFANIEWFNHSANLLLFFIFIIVNISAIVLNYKEHTNLSKEQETNKKWYQKFKFHSVIGLISSIGLFIFSFTQI